MELLPVKSVYKSNLDLIHVPPSTNHCSPFLSGTNFNVNTVVSSKKNQNVDIKHVSIITFLRYAQNQKIKMPNNLKFWEQ
jgi:hypothetical protein